MVIKATLHQGRLKGKSKGQHNDRSFDTKKNDSIVHPEHAQYNQYYVTSEDGKFLPVKGGKDEFARAEREFYRKNFKAGQDAKNARNKAQGHKERCRTIEQVRKNAKTAPMELIFQIGSEKKPYNDMGNTARMFRQITMEIRKKYPKFKIINIAIHYDELTPHCHVRGAFISKDDFGYDVPNQTKALKEMGFSLPNPEEPRGQKNNELIPFTAELRTRWYDLIEEMEPEITIDREPVKDAKHQSHKKYNKEKIDGLKQQYDAIQRNIISTDWGRLQAMEEFIEEKGLVAEFEDFAANYEFTYEE